MLIYEDIIKSGYARTDVIKEYDSFIDYTYGSLRSRDEQVERIGKKYQKIFLYREMGNVFDNYSYSPRYGYEEREIVKSEQGNSFRQIDLTNTIKENDFEGKKVNYPFYRYQKWEDMKWFKLNDVEKYINELFTSTYLDEEYYVLQGYWTLRENKKENFREIWLQTRTYLFDKDKRTQLLHWLQGKDFEGRWMPEGHNSIYDCGIGEYPWSPSAVNILGQDDEQFFRNETSAPCYLHTTVNEYVAEKDSPFSNENKIGSYMLPNKFLTEKMNLVWDGAYGYKCNGSLVIINGKNNMLYINKKFLLNFLEVNNLGIIWTVLGEKQKVVEFYERMQPGRREFSYSYSLDENGDICRNHEFVNIVESSSQL